MPDTVLVRLKPYDKRKGNTAKTFTYRSATFVNGNWYKVSPATAAYLAKVPQRPEDELAPLAFDVCTQEEATALVEAERLAARKQTEPDTAITIKDLTSKDGEVWRKQDDREEDTPSKSEDEEEPAVVVPGAPRRAKRRSSKGHR